MTATDQGFDLDRYLRTSKKVDLSNLAWDQIKDHRVTVEGARCLTYMMDIESHTVICRGQGLPGPAMT